MDENGAHYHEDREEGIALTTKKEGVVKWTKRPMDQLF